MAIMELWWLLNLLREWESLDLEAAIADAFRASGIYWVKGGH